MTSSSQKLIRNIGTVYDKKVENITIPILFSFMVISHLLGWIPLFTISILVVTGYKLHKSPEIYHTIVLLSFISKPLLNQSIYILRSRGFKQYIKITLGKCLYDVSNC